jgi:hypothetical protein
MRSGTVVFPVAAARMDGDAFAFVDDVDAARLDRPPTCAPSGDRGRSRAGRAGQRRAAVRRNAGDGVPVVIDRLISEIRIAQIFVAVLGVLSFTFAKASWTQTPCRAAF